MIWYIVSYDLFSINNENVSKTQMAEILLGIRDEPIIAGAVSHWNLNKMGGSPDWMFDIDSSQMSCHLCRMELTFICQTYCPLSASPYHRTLYVFACSNRLCWNKAKSWMVVRQQMAAVQQNAVQPQKLTDFAADNDWGDGADDWGDDEEAASGENISSSMSRTPSSNPAMLCQDVACSDPNNMDDSHVTQVKLSESDCTEVINVPQSERNEGDIASTDDLVSSPENNCSNNHANSTANETLNIQSLSLCQDVSQATDKVAVLAEEINVDPTLCSLYGFVKGLSSLSSSCERRENVDIGVAQAVILMSYFVNVINEPKLCNVLEYERTRAAEYSKSQGIDLDSLQEESSSKCSRGAGSGGGEKYEKIVPKHGDKVFDKFMRRNNLCPQQIIRYSYNGNPLHLRSPSSEFSTVPTCICGAARIFEMQLMPAMVNFLKVTPVSDVCVEFGSVYIYTCSRSCWSDVNQVKQEHIIVDPDTDECFFRS